MGRAFAAILFVMLAFGAAVLALSARFRAAGLARVAGLARLLDRLGLPELSDRCWAFCRYGVARATAALGRLAVLAGLKPVGAALRRKLCELAKGLGIPVQTDNPGLSGGGPSDLAQNGDSSAPEMDTLHCRVQLTSHEQDGVVRDAFGVDICGLIEAPCDKHSATLMMWIVDATDGVSQAAPVYSHLKQSRMPDSPAFCFNADLGRLPHKSTILTDWTSVARVPLGWLSFPRAGRRNLLFHTVILSRQDGRELARACFNMTFEHETFGYMDAEENIERAKMLAVGLAFAVSASDSKLFNCEIELIKSWARDNVGLSHNSERAERRLEKELNRTVTFFRNGNQLDVRKVCREIAEIVPVADRYDILNLCLHVVQTKGSAAAQEVAMLKNLAAWLEVDMDRFRSMMEKVLPVGIHEVKDTEAILGITADMSGEQARCHLNREYSKWNSRVTNPDAEIRCQADQMLGLIAEARRQYVGQTA